MGNFNVLRAGVGGAGRALGRDFVGSTRRFSTKLGLTLDSMSDDLMIEVANLTKRYAGNTAVSDISFTVKRGEIVGLLGPNGAGKSTTMRILSCYLPATSGTVRVAGLDVFQQSDEVRRRIGYMPENNPLHHDMRVREYLKFRARLKGLGRKRSRQRVDVVMEQCGLTDVSRRIIGQLSKGYRQRVGLADALVHEPELIILDEPTIGLDPNQIRSVRQLIKGLGGTHTVLISTHILPEAEMTCHRVVIMFDGKNPGGRHAGESAEAHEQQQPGHRGNRRAAGRVAGMLGANGGDRAVRRVAQRGRVFPLRADAAGRRGFAAPHLCAGARAGLVAARADPQPALAGGHLRPGDPAGRGGGRLMRAYWTLTRRELAGFFLSLSGYIIIAAALFLMGYSFVVILVKLQRADAHAGDGAVLHHAVLLADPAADDPGHHDAACLRWRSSPARSRR